MKLLDKIKKLKEGGLITEKEYNEIKQTLKNQGLQDLTKNDSYNVDNHELPEQGKLTNHEQKIINKFGEDINNYYPKLKRGGILGGHDYYNGFCNEHDGVVQAVTEFVIKNNLQLFVELPDWWCKRPL